MRGTLIAARSSYELEMHLLIAQRLNFGKEKPIASLLEEVTDEQKMLIGFLGKLRR